MVFEALIKGHKLQLLLDSGAEGNFISQAVVTRLGLPSNSLQVAFQVSSFDGEYGPTCTSTVNCKLQLGSYHDQLDLLILPQSSYDIILGKPWFNQYNPQIDWPHNRVSFKHGNLKVTLVSECKLQTSKQFGRTLREIQKNCEDGKYLVATVQQISPSVDTSTRLQQILTEYGDVLVKDLPKTLPPRRAVECTISLQPNAEPPNQRPYRLSPKEMKELQMQLDNLMKSRLIRPSTSPYAAPVLFVKKGDGSFRMCIDYRALNRLTIKNKYPLPRIDDLLDALGGAQYFSKIDLKSAYHQVRVAEEDIPKTAFRTQYGHYEYTVMPFGLTNAPAIFQRLMNQIFRRLLQKCVIIYLDDILIYSQTREAHYQHIKEVLEILRDNKLYASHEKCQFFQSTISFVGHLISADGLAVQKSKTEAIRDWPVPVSRKQLQAFLGLANYYRKFVPSFATISAPLTKLTSDKIKFDWTAKQQESFDLLKERLTHTTFLQLPNYDFPFVIHTDASDVAIGAVLEQDQGFGLKPIAFYSKALLPAQRNYATYDRELLAIVQALKSWRSIIYGITTTVYTDHQPLVSFLTKKDLRTRHARWWLELAEFQPYLSITYKKGQANIVADALSRRPTLSQALSKSQETLQLNVVTEFQLHEDFFIMLKKAYQKDLRTREFLRNPTNDSCWYLEDGLIFTTEGMIGTRLYIPDDHTIKQIILRECHDIPIAGHLGRDKTLTNITSSFFWPQIRRDVAQYVQQCQVCQQSKATNQKPFGLHRPLDIPTRRWEQVHMDFITALPMSKDGHDAILTVIDRLTKTAVFIPTIKAISAKATARLFFDYVFRHYGMPSVIISDRDPRFTSNFWKEFLELLGTELRMSTAFHPQTDGMAERYNRTIEEMLRSYVSQTNSIHWDKMLTPLEFAYNSSVNAATGYSPFVLLYGEQPRVPISFFQTCQLPDVFDRSIKSIWKSMEVARNNIRRSQEKQKKRIDEKHQVMEFEEGDLVYLSTVNLSDNQMPAVPRKLWPKFIGPFQIERKVSSHAYKLLLPEEFKIHNTFNVNLLKPYVPPANLSADVSPLTFLLQNLAEPPVESIVDRRGYGLSRQYLVKWKNQHEAHNTWVTPDKLKKVWYLVKKFNRKFQTTTRKTAMTQV